MPSTAHLTAVNTWIARASLRPATETVCAFLREAPELFAVEGLPAAPEARRAAAWEAVCTKVDLYAGQPDILSVMLDRHLGRDLSERFTAFFVARTTRMIADDAQEPESRRRPRGMIR